MALSHYSYGKNINAESLVEVGRSITLHQWYFNCEIVELQVFASASMLSYGTVLYLRVVHDGIFFINLQTSKSKAAPFKILNIPRLSLAGMHLTFKVAKHYIKKSKCRISSSHLWTYSMDVRHNFRSEVGQ